MFISLLVYFASFCSFAVACLFACLQLFACLLDCLLVLLACLQLFACLLACLFTICLQLFACAVLSTCFIVCLFKSETPFLLIHQCRLSIESGQHCAQQINNNKEFQEKVTTFTFLPIFRLDDKVEIGPDGPFTTIQNHGTNLYYFDISRIQAAATNGKEQCNFFLKLSLSRLCGHKTAKSIF